MPTTRALLLTLVFAAAFAVGFAFTTIGLLAGFVGALALLGLAVRGGARLLRR